MLENGALQELSIIITTASSRNILTYLKGLIVRKLDRAISSGSSADNVNFCVRGSPLGRAGKTVIFEQIRKGSREFKAVCA